MTQPRQDDPQLKLRLPRAVKDAISTSAEGNNRSVNAEIVARLEASLSPGAATLEPEIAAILRRYIDAEVQRRLREIAAQIGGQ